MSIVEWKYFSFFEGDLKHIVKVVFAILGISTVHFWGFMRELPPGIVGIVDHVLFAHFVFQFLIFFSLSLFFARSGVFAAYLFISAVLVNVMKARDYLRIKFKFEDLVCDAASNEIVGVNIASKFFIIIEIFTIIFSVLIFSIYYLFGQFSIDAILHAIFIAMLVGWIVLCAYEFVADFDDPAEAKGVDRGSDIILVKKSHYSMFIIVFILTLAYWTGEIRFHNVAERHLVTAVIAGEKKDVAALGWISGGLLVFIPGDECDEFHVTSSQNPISARQCE